MRALTVALALGLAGQAQAVTCQGADLIEAMPAEARATLRAEAEAVPHARGLVWRASKGPARMLIVGTYHLDDPRHDTLAARIAPELARADALLVEAGPEEQARLTAALTADPTLTIDPTGPPLSARLDAGEWALMREAMAARGIPELIAARMRPWYASVMLGMAPCMLAQAGEGLVGLDHRLIAQAEGAGVQVRAVEPWDTLFTLFADLTPQDEADLIRTALAGADQADDMAVTMADAYFDGRGWEIWLLQRHLAETAGLQSPAEVAAQTALTQEVLLNRRNRTWLAPMLEAADAAAERGKGVVVAVGLLHLPGEAGVLGLLEGEGWKVEAVE